MGKGRKERLIPVHFEIMGRVKKYIDLKKENGVTTNRFLVNNKLEPMSKKQLYSFVVKEVEKLQAKLTKLQPKEEKKISGKKTASKSTAKKTEEKAAKKPEKAEKKSKAKK